MLVVVTTGVRGVRGVLAVLAGLMLVGCAPGGTPPVTPSPEPTPSVVRTVTDANLISAEDLPVPSDGEIKEFTKNARPADQSSICQHPLAELGATAMVSRSFKYTYGYSPKPTSKVPLANEPSTYTFALQFGSPSTAEQARQTYKSWIDTCLSGDPKRGPYVLEDRGFDWTPITVTAGSAEVAEIVYRQASSKSESVYWESSGLTVVDDRMMITIHVTYKPESLFVLHPEEDEEGYPHPQLGLMRIAADQLTK
jgi:hypothetical protein